MPKSDDENDDSSASSVLGILGLIAGGGALAAAGAYYFLNKEEKQSYTPSFDSKGGSTNYWTPERPNTKDWNSPSSSSSTHSPSSRTQDRAQRSSSVSSSRSSPREEALSSAHSVPSPSTVPQERSQASAHSVPSPSSTPQLEAPPPLSAGAPSGVLQQLRRPAQCRACTYLISGRDNICLIKCSVCQIPCIKVHEACSDKDVTCTDCFQSEQ